MCTGHWTWLLKKTLQIVKILLLMLFLTLQNLAWYYILFWAPMGDLICANISLLEWAEKITTSFQLNNFKQRKSFVNSLSSLPFSISVPMGMLGSGFFVKCCTATLFFLHVIISGAPAKPCCQATLRVDPLDSVSLVSVKQILYFKRPASSPLPFPTSVPQPFSREIFHFLD